MRNTNVRNIVLPASLLAIALVATTPAGCSTGSDSTGSPGTAGTGTSAGTAGTGTSAGTAGTGTSAGTAGTGTSAATAGTGASAGTAGTGTSAGTAGSTGTGTGTAGAPATTGVCAGTGTRALTLDQGKVDDFEEPSLLTGWSSFNDVMPTPDSFKIMQVAGGAIGTGHSGHYMGTGAKTPTLGGYGVGTLYNMAIDKTAMIYCVDVTAFDGVTFWAKAAAANSKITVNFVIPEENAVKDGGDCTTGCYLHPQKLVTLTTDWAQYSVTFASATGSSGMKVKGRIQELLFLSPDANWDFSLDEIQLYKGTPPATPVGGNSTM
jgi:hypothetical protein